MKALSIQNPWAALIINGFKKVENRTWKTNYRGPFLIHVGKKLDMAADVDLETRIHPVTGEHLNLDRKVYRSPLGGLVGMAEIYDCVRVTEMEDGDWSMASWAVGPWCFLIRNAKPLPFRPLRGHLGLFEVEESASVPRPL